MTCLHYMSNNLTLLVFRNLQTESTQCVYICKKNFDGKYFYLIKSHCFSLLKHIYANSSSINAQDRRLQKFFLRIKNHFSPKSVFTIRIINVGMTLLLHVSSTIWPQNKRNEINNSEVFRKSLLNLQIWCLLRSHQI